MPGSGLTLACLSLLAFTLPTLAQSPTPPPAGSDWSRVQRVVVGSEIRVRSKRPTAPPSVFVPNQLRVDCLYVSASDDELVCTHTFKVLFFPIHRQFRIARLDVASVRLTRGDLSSFVGGAIGAGAGVGIAGIIVATNSESDHSEDVIGYSLVAALGAIIGSGIGRTTDFMGGPTLYRAP